MPQSYESDADTGTSEASVVDPDKVVKEFIDHMEKRHVKRKLASDMVKVLEQAAKSRSSDLSSYIDIVTNFIEMPSLTITTVDSALAHWLPLLLRCLTSKEIVPLLSSEQFVRLTEALCVLISTKELHPKAIGLLLEAMVALVIISDVKVALLPQSSIKELEESMNYWSEKAFFVENITKRSHDSIPSGPLRKAYTLM